MADRLRELKDEQRAIVREISALRRRYANISEQIRQELKERHRKEKDVR